MSENILNYLTELIRFGTELKVTIPYPVLYDKYNNNPNFDVVKEALETLRENKDLLVIENYLANDDVEITVKFKENEDL